MPYQGSKLKSSVQPVAGFKVIMPDYYRGTWIDPRAGGDVRKFILDQSQWKDGKLKSDVEEKVIPYAEKNGAKTFGTIGFCWGTYPVIKMSSNPKIKGGVSMHPSHPNIIKLLGEDEEALLKEISAPQLFCPSKSDSQSVKNGGLGEQILGDQLQIIEFPEMSHGWTVRGDLSDPKVERDVKKAFDAAIDFFSNKL